MSDDKREVPPKTGLLFYQWVNTALDLVFPPRCAGCGAVDSLWCGRCQAAIERVPLTAQMYKLHPLTASAATSDHSGILQQAIHALKYEHTRTVAVSLGDRLTACYRLLGWAVDMIVPVPLHTTRLRERGYNQSQLIGERMAQLLLLPCVPLTLTRWRSTATQVGLSRSERQHNLQDAFRADPMRASGQRILLIDDVQTTGATLQASAHALFNVGAAAVYSMTVTAARL